MQGVVVRLPEQPGAVRERDEVAGVHVDPVIVSLLAQRELRAQPLVVQGSDVDGRERVCLTRHLGQRLVFDRPAQALQTLERPGEAQVRRAAVRSPGRSIGRAAAGRGGGQRRDGSRLERVELIAAHRPLDVLGRAEAVFGVARQTVDERDLVVAERRPSAQVVRKRRHMHAGRRRDDPLQPLRRPVREHGGVTSRQRPSVGLHRAVDQALVQAVDGLDQGVPGLVGRDAEGHAGALAGDDLLDDHRHGAASRVEAELAPVEQRAVRPERRPHELHVLEDPWDAAHVDVRFVQPGEGGLGRVLPGRRRAHHRGDGGEAGGQPIGERRLQVVGQRRREEEVAHAQGDVPDLLPAHVFEGLAIELRQDAFAQVRAREKGVVGVGRHGDEGGDPEAGGLQAGQRKGFATDAVAESGGHVGICDDHGGRAGGAHSRWISVTF